MHTFRKLPIQAPVVKTSAKSGQSAAAAAGSSIPEMTWVNGYPAWGNGSNAAPENRRGTDRWSVPRRSCDWRRSYDTVRFGEPAAGALFQV